MGQYFFPIILGDEKSINETIRAWLCSSPYNSGSKIIEHYYVGDGLVDAVEYLLSPIGQFHMSRLAWCGDYAPNEPNSDVNLYNMTEKYKTRQQYPAETNNNLYIINHTKCQYVEKPPANSIHPLPLLTAEGLDKLMYGNNVGLWARDIISVDNTFPDDYKLLITDFRV